MDRPGPAKCGADRLYGALAALRRASAEGRRAMNAEWRYVATWLTGEAGHQRGAAEASQLALIRVSRGIDGLRAETPAQAMAWLRRVLRTGFSDVHRDAKNEPVAAALRMLHADERDRTLRRLAAPEPERQLDPRTLDAWLDVVLDEVDDWLDANVPSIIKRTGARRRAEIALLRHVRKLSLDDLRELLSEDVARDTLYKWFERGRDEVLIPTLERWAARPALGKDELAFVATLTSILLGTRRDKSRKPRKSHESHESLKRVSKEASRTSVQYEPEPDDEGHSE